MGASNWSSVLAEGNGKFVTSGPGAYEWRFKNRKRHMRRSVTDQRSTTEAHVNCHDLLRALVVANCFGALTASAFAAPAPSPQVDAGWIRILEEGKDVKAFLIRPDGTQRKEISFTAPNGPSSPDGKNILLLRSEGVESVALIADADGKNARRVSPEKIRAAAPCWSPDGKQIAFLGLVGDYYQAHVMDRDGTNVQQSSDAKLGVESLKFAPDGRLSYLARNIRRGILQPCDLVVVDGKKTKILVNEVIISDYAWSPDGKTIAYSRPGALVFHDLISGKEQEKSFVDIEARIAGHAARTISWSPDSKAVACTVIFWGGRPEFGPKLFGDDELFVIPRSGKAIWFNPGVKIGQIEWVSGK